MWIREAGSIALYLHIPFCRFMCHYCDFAKTANYDNPLFAAYMRALAEHLTVWRGKLGSSISSIFVGGGTPSLVSDYAPIFAPVADLLAPKAEITIEANPCDLSASNLAAWKQSGINRISIGVQSFSEVGLKFLTRQHTPEDVRRGVELAHKYFDNINLDLIFGWHGQNLAMWRADLEAALQLKPKHMSCYLLTHNSQTPIGRAYLRSKLPQTDEAELCAMYELTREMLGAQGFAHGEVSNWHLPGYACHHNWNTWTDGHYLGVGSGAHSYLPEGDIGRRFAYDKNERLFVKTDAASVLAGELLHEDPRKVEDWVSEYVSTAIRNQQGVDLQRMRAVAGLEFVPNFAVATGIEQGLFVVQGDCVRLLPQEWFREGAWGREVLKSLR